MSGGLKLVTFVCGVHDATLATLTKCSHHPRDRASWLIQLSESPDPMFQILKLRWRETKRLMEDDIASKCRIEGCSLGTCLPTGVKEQCSHLATWSNRHLLFLRTPGSNSAVLGAG